MKTAISLEDSLMAQADDAARDLGLSRSGLIAEALRDYLKKRRDERIIKQLNEVYGGEPDLEELRLVRRLRTKVSVEKW